MVTQSVVVGGSKVNVILFPKKSQGTTDRQKTIKKAASCLNNKQKLSPHSTHDSKILS